MRIQRIEVRLNKGESIYSTIPVLSEQGLEKEI